MKLTIDKDKCIGCGQCISICEEVFDFDEEGLAKVAEEDIPNEMEEEVSSAIENCPTGAIIEE